LGSVAITKSHGRQGRRPRRSRNAHGAAKYIASLAEELAELARRNGLETLSYILEMARIEADHKDDK